jgi:hypothetical protein
MPPPLRAACLGPLLKGQNGGGRNKGISRPLQPPALNAPCGVPRICPSAADTVADVNPITSLFHDAPLITTAGVAATAAAADIAVAAYVTDTAANVANRRYRHVDPNGSRRPESRRPCLATGC